MSSTSLYGQYGACCRWLTNGLICDKCNCCFHINCTNVSPSLIEKSMPWYCISCKYQNHARYQNGRSRYLKQELKAAWEEINCLQAGNNSSKIKDHGILDNLCNWSKPKNSKARSVGSLQMMYLMLS